MTARTATMAAPTVELTPWKDEELSMVLGNLRLDPASAPCSVRAWTFVQIIRIIMFTERRMGHFISPPGCSANAETRQSHPLTKCSKLLKRERDLLTWERIALVLANVLRTAIGVLAWKYLMVVSNTLHAGF